ncbi:MAG: DNA primase [Bacteroidia bacterium]|nr:DNA primase [Bacteroidia bacterium]MDW8235387.1 DNA primase [Bacteroidia bacterium]
MSWLRDEVLRRADIVEVISEYLPLKKRGANYWALSPFKPERTPSFAVSPIKQIFKCFASGKGGDAIRFVMEIEGISYGEALRKLAQKYGIDIEDSPEKSYTSKEKQRYLALYQEVVRFYRHCLKGSPGELYLQKRRLSEEIIERFSLGYAPAGGDELTRHLLRLGYAEKQLIEWGISLRQENTDRLYDRFRGRVIFPLADEQGQIVALAGRIVTDSDQPKYLNSPETPFYRKSELLYGLFEARSELRKGKPALIVEGYMDVLSLHQMGFRHAVATCGTALTEEHLQRLKRHTKEVILLFDSDEAGQAAAERAIFPALSVGFFVRVAQVPNGKDPDEYIQSEGASAFQHLLEGATSWALFLASKLPPEPSPQQRYQLLQKLGQGLQSLPDLYLRRAYAEEIAQHLHIPLEFWEGFSPPPVSSPSPQTTQRITAERELLRIWFLYPERTYMDMPIARFLSEEVRHMTFADPTAEKVRAWLCREINEKDTLPSLQQLAEELGPEAQDWVAGLLMEKYTLSPHWRNWDDSTLEEDPIHILESNLYLLHLAQLDQLLSENLHHLQRLTPEDPAYEETLSLHQFLLRQRNEIARRQGVLLPYRKPQKE